MVKKEVDSMWCKVSDFILVSYANLEEKCGFNFALKRVFNCQIWKRKKIPR